MTYSSDSNLNGKDSQPKPRRFPFGVIWIVFAIIILAVVLIYDRRAIADAKEHIVLGKQYQDKELYREAVSEFESALSNKRLGRKDRALVALDLANLYFDKIQDYPLASKYFVLAKLNSPTFSDNREVAAKEKKAKELSKGPGISEAKGYGENKTLIVNNVELISPPQADLKGPTIANYSGGKILAGAILRQLKSRPDFNDPNFRNNTEKIQDLIQTYVEKEMAYQAAISSGVQNDPDVSEILYDYQKDLITQRYLAERNNSAQIITDTEIHNYYIDNINKYQVKPSIMVAAIVTLNEIDANKASEALQSGTVFKDVVTSFSIDEATKRNAGIVGELTNDSDAVGNLFKDKQIVTELFGLPLNSPTKPIEKENHYYIFNVLRKTPGSHITVDEARVEIERVLRGEKFDKAKNGIKQESKFKFEPKLVNNPVNQLWKYLGDSTKSISNQNTATTATAMSKGK